jgi:hypothetical protein
MRSLGRLSFAPQIVGRGHVQEFRCALPGRADRWLTQSGPAQQLPEILPDPHSSNNRASEVGAVMLTLEDCLWMCD